MTHLDAASARAVPPARPARPPAGARPARGRLPHLDGIRALAAGYVVLHHAWLTIFPVGRPELTGAHRWGGLLDHGSSAVAVFLVVSGYSLTLATVRHGGHLPGGAADFVRRRAWRIIPTYWAALLLSAALGVTLLSEPAGGLWGSAVPFTGQDLLAHGLLLQDAWSRGRISYLFWSIALEWHFYLLFPLLLLAVRRWPPAAVLTTVAVAAAAVSIAVSPDVVLLPSVFLLACFAAGVGACRAVAAGGVLTARGREHRPPWALLAAGLAVGTVAVVAAVGRTLVADIGAGCAVAALLVALGTGRAPGVARALSVAPLAWLGACSYSLYLVHPLVVQGAFLLTRTLGLAPGWHVLALLAVSAPASVLAARLFFLIAERPFTRSPPPLRRRGAPTPWMAP